MALVNYSMNHFFLFFTFYLFIRRQMKEIYDLFILLSSPDLLQSFLIEIEDTVGEDIKKLYLFYELIISASSLSKTRIWVCQHISRLPSAYRFNQFPEEGVIMKPLWILEDLWLQTPDWLVNFIYWENSVQLW